MRFEVQEKFRQIRRQAGIYIAVVCTIACAVNVYVLNRSQRFTYEFYSAFAKIEDAVAQLTIALTELGLPPSEIVPPVDFLYVDAERVATLYSEIEPSLVEQKRTLTQESKKDKGVDLERQPLTLKLGGSTATKETREFKAVDPSTARKCLDLMNGLLARQAPPYYATFAQFGTFRTLVQAKDSMKSIHETLQQPSLFLIEVPQGKIALLKQMNKINQKTSPAVIEKAIRAQLSQLSGLIIVQGDFDRIAIHRDSAEFREQFKPAPNPIFFHLVISAAAKSCRSSTVWYKQAVHLLPEHGKRLVLGNIIQKWDGGPYIEISPLAIF